MTLEEMLSDDRVWAGLALVAVLIFARAHTAFVRQAYRDGYRQGRRDGAGR